MHRFYNLIIKVFVVLLMVEGCIGFFDELWVTFTRTSSHFSEYRNYATNSLLFLAPPFITSIIFSRVKNKLIWVIAPLFLVIAIIAESIILVITTEGGGALNLLALEAQRSDYYSDYPLAAVFNILLSIGQTVYGIFLFKVIINNHKFVDLDSKEMPTLLKIFSSVTIPSLAIAFVALFQIFSIPFLFENISDGYLDFDGTRLFSIEKQFEKNGKIVRMIPMIHIGKSDFYQNILSDLEKKKTVILMEGLKDRDNLIKKLSYNKLAKNLGLTSQTEVFNPMKIAKRNRLVTVVSADIQSSDLDKDTIKFINKISNLINLDDADKVLNLIGQSNPAGIPSQLFIRDIIEKRNNHLMKIFYQHLGNADIIIIPWGALHLPDIEKRLVREGFKQREKTYSRLALNVMAIVQRHPSSKK